MNQEQKNNGGQPEVRPMPEVKPEVKKEPPKSAPPKKELTQAELLKRRKMLVMPLFFLIFGGAMWLIFAPSKKDTEQTAGQSGFNAEIPMPKDEGIYSDKRTAYEQEAQRQREQDKIRSLQDFSTMFEKAEQDEQLPPAEYYESPELSGGNTSQRPATRSTIQSSATAYQDVNRQLGSFYEEPASKADEQAQSEMESRIQELERQLTEKSEADKQLELIEKSYAIAAKYMPQQAGQAEQEIQTAAVGTKDKVVVQPVSVVRRNVVSLLSAPMSDAEFIDAFIKPRNMGFITAAGNEGVTDKNTIRACVYQTITLTTGKELQIRLLEPMRAGNVLIPTNSIITGACRIGGERMDVTINSIQYAGNIIPVELQVYDLDGQRGISVPNSDEIKAAKEIASQMAQSAGSSITITDDAGSQLAADLGKSLIQGASQYVSKKMSEVKVTVKANYGILLLPKTQ